MVVYLVYQFNGVLAAIFSSEKEAKRYIEEDKKSGNHIVTTIQCWKVKEKWDDE